MASVSGVGFHTWQALAGGAAAPEYHPRVTSLDLALLYLVAAVLGVVVCRSLKLPPMLGYLAVGVLIGPNALAFAHDSASNHDSERNTAADSSSGA